MEGIRRAFYDEQDGIAVVAARLSPPPKASPGPRSPDEEEKLKKEHKVASQKCAKLVCATRLRRRRRSGLISLTECGIVGVLCGRSVYVGERQRRCCSSVL